MSIIKEKKMKNIVIVGGSHSGFSAAWMMLNGPATYNRNTHGEYHYKKATKFPDAPRKTV
jgi:hypothetical protein